MTILYLDGPTANPNPLELEHYCVIFIFVVAYLLRNNKYFSWVWFIIKYFLLILILILAAEQIKKGLKDWWDK